MNYTADQLKYWLKYNILNWDELLDFTHMSNDEMTKYLKTKPKSKRSFTNKISKSLNKK